MSPDHPLQNLAPRHSWVWGIVAAALGWGYWPTLVGLSGAWSADPRYSHGFLIPAFVAVVIWLRRDRLATVAGTPAPGGISLIALGCALHLGGAATNQEWVEVTSVVPSLAGLCVLGWGWAVLRVVGGPIAFLAFMAPLPYRVELGLGGPLQNLATHASTAIFLLLGYPALQEGNTITLGHARIGVIEACNGLSMLTFFLAISVGSLMLVRRPRVEQIMIIGGAAPIALVANIARITATGLLIENLGHGIAGIDFHDLSGYLMMPFALILLGAENALIDRLFTPTKLAQARPSSPLPEVAPIPGDLPSDRASGREDAGLSGRGHSFKIELVPSGR